MFIFNKVGIKDGGGRGRRFGTGSGGDVLVLDFEQTWNVILWHSSIYQQVWELRESHCLVLLKSVLKYL